MSNTEQKIIDNNGVADFIKMGSMPLAYYVKSRQMLSTTEYYEFRDLIGWKLNNSGSIKITQFNKHMYFYKKFLWFFKRKVRASGILFTHNGRQC